MTDARKPINIAIIGVGNCASSLVQGLAHYAGRNDASGLMHHDLGGYSAGDIRVVAAWDIDRRKVGQDISRAIFAPPNCTAVFAADVPETGAVVSMGRLLDGVAGTWPTTPTRGPSCPPTCPNPRARTWCARSGTPAPTSC